MVTEKQLTALSLELIHMGFETKNKSLKIILHEISTNRQMLEDFAMLLLQHETREGALIALTTHSDQQTAKNTPELARQVGYEMFEAAMLHSPGNGLINPYMDVELRAAWLEGVRDAANKDR